MKPRVLSFLHFLPVLTNENIFGFRVGLFSLSHPEKSNVVISELEDVIMKYSSTHNASFLTYCSSYLHCKNKMFVQGIVVSIKLKETNWNNHFALICALKRTAQLYAGSHTLTQTPSVSSPLCLMSPSPSLTPPAGIPTCIMGLTRHCVGWREGDGEENPPRKGRKDDDGTEETWKERQRRVEIWGRREWGPERGKQTYSGKKNLFPSGCY